MKFPTKQQNSVLMMVGGYSEDGSSYSLVSPSYTKQTHNLVLPPLPEEDIWDPVVGLSDEKLFLCRMSYEGDESMLCWRNKLGQDESWVPIMCPDVSLYRAVGTVHIIFLLCRL